MCRYDPMSHLPTGWLSRFGMMVALIGVSGCPQSTSSGDASVPCGDASACMEVVEVGAGGGFSCARRRSGAVECWGDNGSGQLGTGKTDDPRVKPAVVVELAAVSQLVLGGSHACALAVDDIWCWGSNTSGQLAQGSETSESGTPVSVADVGDSVQTVAAGSAHVCAVLGDRAVACWGLNTHGETGVERDVGRVWTPTRVAGLGEVVSLGLGKNHSCALVEDGTVQCWGNGRFGQLGDGTNATRSEPKPVLGLSGVTQVTGGGEHTCALREDGTVWCWGDNSRGQLGAGTMDNRNEPTPVAGIENAVEVAAGDRHSCARLGNGTVLCWGDNGEVGASPSGGALGDGTTTNRQEPVRVIDLPPATDIGLGAVHSCAVARDGGVWCWGSGLMGDGDFYEAATRPVRADL